MASANWSHVSTENTNFARLCKLLVDGGTRALRNVFDSIHPPHLLQSHLLDPKNHGILKNLQSKKILFKEQWDKLYPTGGSTVHSKGFDITLLCVLLRSICHFKKPTGGWNNPPSPTSTNTEDDIVRVKLYRNQLYGHSKEAAITDTHFNNYWKEIATVLVRLGGACYQEEIDKLKVSSMDTLEEKYYIQCLEEWAKNDEKIMEKLEEVMSKMEELGEKMDEVEQKLERVTTMLQTASCSHKETKAEDADLYSRNLKTAMKAQLERHQEFVISPLIGASRIQDIYTNPNVHIRSKPDSRLLGGKPTQLTKINIADIFLYNFDKDKSILMVGNPGMGKSLICRKLVQDWAEDCLFPKENPNIKFTFLITFRQLNMLTSNELNLRDLLNLCSMLDESVMINHSMMEYIIEHPNQVFIVIDGYDEYKQCERHTMVSDFESRYPNDPRRKMHVTALVSKLLKKKILRDSVVMVTSRPGEADEMVRHFNFDCNVEIMGFTKQQVLEYVGQYFRSNKEMQAKALSNIKDNEEYLSLGYVPLMCSLMCVYMKYHVNDSKECFPTTLTDFYSEVLLCMENKCNKAILKAGLDKTTASLAVQKNLDKLSELAAESMVHEKYDFTDEDLKRLNLFDEELTCLKSSCLLFCKAGVRKSPFSEILHVYSFCHATIQEYFAARYFVQMNKMPAQNIPSDMFLQFFAGLMKSGKDTELIKKLLEYISKMFSYSTGAKCLIIRFRRTALSVKCLYEYGDREFAKGIVMVNEDNTYSDKNGWIVLEWVDFKVPAMLVDIFADLNQEKTLPSNSRVPYYLYITGSYSIPVALSGIETLLKSLSNDFCTVTVLKLDTYIDDGHIKCLSKYLPATKVTNLDLSGINRMTRDGVMAIVPYCNKLAYLRIRLYEHDRTAVTELFKDKNPSLELDLC